MEMVVLGIITVGVLVTTAVITAVWTVGKVQASNEVSSAIVATKVDHLDIAIGGLQSAIDRQSEQLNKHDDRLIDLELQLRGDRRDK